MFWVRGTQQELSDVIGLTPQHVNDILHRRTAVSKELALQLEDASRSVLGGAGVPWDVWLFSRSTRHPAFFGDPVDGEK